MVRNGLRAESQIRHQNGSAQAPDKRSQIIRIRRSQGVFFGDIHLIHTGPFGNPQHGIMKINEGPWGYRQTDIGRTDRRPLIFSNLSLQKKMRDYRFLKK